MIAAIFSHDLYEGLFAYDLNEEKDCTIVVRWDMTSCFQINNFTDNLHNLCNLWCNYAYRKPVLGNICVLVTFVNRNLCRNM